MRLWAAAVRGLRAAAATPLTELSLGAVEWGWAAEEAALAGRVEAGVAPGWPACQAHWCRVP
jgi:hypothetical protein